MLVRNRQAEAETARFREGITDYLTVLDAQRTFAIPEMWSGIILLGLLGYTLNWLLMLAERQILRWHRGFRSSQLTALGEPR